MTGLDFVGERLHLDDVRVPVEFERLQNIQARIGGRGRARLAQDIAPDDIKIINRNSNLRSES